MWELLKGGSEKNIPEISVVNKGIYDFLNDVCLGWVWETVGWKELFVRIYENYREGKPDRRGSPTSLEDSVDGGDEVAEVVIADTVCCFNVIFG